MMYGGLYQHTRVVLYMYDLCRDQGNLTSSYRPNSSIIKERQLKLACPVSDSSKISGVFLGENK